MELNIEHALQQGVDVHNQGNLPEAESLYRAILQVQPEHPEANHNLGLIAIAVNQSAAALPLFKRALDVNPKIEQFWFSYIGALLKDNQIKNAERAIKMAKKKGFAVEKLDDLGSQSMSLVGGNLPSQSQLDSLFEHFQNGRFDVAKKLAESITKQFPNSQFAWKVLGVIFGKLGQLDDALIANKNAVRIDPQSSEAHYNLAITHQELGRLDEAVSSYTKAIELTPHVLEPSSNLVTLLTTYASQKEVSHPIVKADQEIKEIELTEMTSGLISDDKIIQLFCKSSSIIKSHNLELGTNFSEIFRHNSVDLNCERHLAIFNKFNIIPKFCFGCYKVQVEPRSLLELIKLLVVFDQIELVENNIRKCMIEIRPKISGFYKGLIYCSSPEEAYQIADYLEMIVKRNIGPELRASVKRGCSEYPISYPDYKKINRSGDQLMNYNEDWKQIEEEYDSINPIVSGKIIRSSLSCLNLSDILIIRNWIDYAKGIGDPSVDLLNQNSVFSQTIYTNAKTRLETYPWRESL